MERSERTTRDSASLIRWDRSWSWASPAGLEGSAVPEGLVSTTGGQGLSLWRLSGPPMPQPWGACVVNSKRMFITPLAGKPACWDAGNLV